MAWKRALLAAGVLLMGIVLVSGARVTLADVGNTDRVAMKEIGASNFKFSQSLYKVLAKTPGNIFFSPLSVHSILTMLSLGAKENTLKQLKQGLALPETETTKNGYRHLNKNLKFSADKGVTVSIANKVYATKRAQLSSNYKQMTSNYFNADAENVDFANSEKVRKDINQWVENNTNKKITDIVPAGTLTSDTAMVLVNAVYFKGRWLTQFDPEHTSDGSFYGTKGQERLKFMHVTSEFSYRASDTIKSRVLELPYNGDKLSLVIILPAEKNGFKELEKALATADPKDYLPGQYDKFDVRVKIPKFRLEKETPLVGPLEELGMTDMFANNADLSGLTSSGVPLKVSKVLHKAFFEVNEEGSEAAASTAMAVQTLSLVSDEIQPIDFFATQPFIFMIRHKQSNSILFMGRFVSASDNEGVQPSLPNPTNSRVPQPTQNRPRGQHGQRGQQGSGRQSQGSRGQQNREPQPESHPENGDITLRSGAGTTSNGNLQFGNQQENYDLFDK